MTPIQICPQGRGSGIFRAAILVMAGAGSLLAQNPEFTWSFRPPTSTGLVQISANGTIPFGNVAVNRDQSITFLGENRGPTPWTVSKVTVVSGPFTVTPTSAQLVNPQSSAVFTLTFRPPAIDTFLGRLQLELSNTFGTTVTVSFFMDGRGVAPDFQTSYLFPSGNQTPITNGGTITFDPTPVGSTLTAAFTILNRGTGMGTVNGVTITGAGYTLSGLALLPANVPTDQSLRFNINFIPRDRGTFRGTLRVEFEGSAARSFELVGTGAGPALSFQYLTGGDIKDLPANATLPLPGTNVGSTQSVILLARNSGTTEARVTTIVLSGDGLTLVSVPPLPATLAVGETLRFTVQFAPRTAGLVEGTLRVDTMSFRVEANALGPKFTMSAVLAGVTVPVVDRGTLNFPNTVVGANSQARLEIRNDGTQAGTVAGISATPATFTLSGLPGLPATLAPGQAIQLTIQFAPQNLGNIAGTLQIDDLQINLRGVGGNPPPLPGVTFSTVGDSSGPLEQPSVGVLLAAPYPYDITGTLTLGFVSGSIFDDPAIQFSSGGRTATFRIPANTLEAIFGQSGRTVQFQTGTIAGDIQLTANFAVGQVGLTGTGAATPPAKTVLIASGPPQIRGVRVGAVSGSSFELLITGYASTRSVQRINLTFTGAAGASLGTSTLEANVDGPFSAWYQSDGSRPFGSQFTVAITIGVNGDITAVQSVSVTAANARGTSQAASVNLR